MFHKIKLIISEIDGIITDGFYFYDELCNKPIKKYSSIDFEAINELKKHINFTFLASDNAVNYNLMRKKNIPFYWASKNKRQALLKILERFGVTSEEAMYIGYSYADIPCINYIPMSFCPSNSPKGVQDNVYNILETASGQGVLSEVYELLYLELIRRRQCS